MSDSRRRRSRGDRRDRCKSPPVGEQCEQVEDANVAVAVEIPRARDALKLMCTHVYNGWITAAGDDRVRVID